MQKQSARQSFPVSEKDCQCSLFQFLKKTARNQEAGFSINENRHGIQLMISLNMKLQRIRYMQTDNIPYLKTSSKRKKRPTLATESWENRNEV